MISDDDMSDVEILEVTIALEKKYSVGTTSEDPILVVDNRPGANSNVPIEL